MERYRVGMLAKSKAGHDAGTVYVIIRAEGAYAYVADGRIRTLDRMKKKKWKHLQLINREYDVSSADDAQIRRIIREYCKGEGIEEDIGCQKLT